MGTKNSSRYYRVTKVTALLKNASWLIINMKSQGLLLTTEAAYRSGNGWVRTQRIDAVEKHINYASHRCEW